MTISPYRLGASLYMPAVRTDIVDVVLKNKIPGLSSLIICFEDALAEQDIAAGLSNLHTVLAVLRQHRHANHSHANRDHDRPLVFIRPRHQAMARLLVDEFDLSTVNGFVLPKFTQATLDEWTDILEPTQLLWMPTLETAEVFDALAMRELVNVLDTHPCRSRMLAIRVGGNDLLNVLSLRRQRHKTLYDGPLGYVMKMLVSTFGSRQFALTAPVCELIERNDILTEELKADIEHGFVGKTAIHPNQIDIINQALAVEATEYEDALRIVNSGAAVFKHNGAMCEPATHTRWAENILTRAQYYGHQKRWLTSIPG
ncbi:MAG: HpcH/HpaI aldolase/citrate lyase family protein [Oceanisphaera sp.]|uniref:HpcH/HpaI aldolase/citrate lyase family protein n=1 Tax=Oceanisphaera sp. TaxID=1929979 RepID=UPI003C789B49